MRVFISIVFVLLVLAGCDKQINQIRPLTQIDQDGELSSLEGIEEATIGNYRLLRSTSFGNYDQSLSILSESRGNNVTLRQFGPVQKNTDAFFYRNSPSPTLGHSDGFFRGSYQLIVGVNAVLEGIARFETSGSASLVRAEKDKLLYAKGENVFLRALVYFNLIRLYGKPYYQQSGNTPGVPLKQTSLVSDNPARATVKEVYAFIVEELKLAAQLMKVPVEKTNSFANTAAAWALLSRAYLYMGGSVASPDKTFNEAAVTYADSALLHNGGRFELLQGDDYIHLFAADERGDLGRAQFATNQEILFAFDNLPYGTSVGLLYNYDGQYNRGATFVPSADLKLLFAAADSRSQFFRLRPGTGVVESTKYLVAFGELLSMAPVIYCRMGELYLNRAEAHAKLGDFLGARKDLTTIHTRAGLPAAETSHLADAAVLSAILFERRLELAFEGHAGYDYYRNGLAMSRLAADNNGTAVTIQADDVRVVLTIPVY
ncbi:RagB/SusD family nutrient uptake outer membrane protein [Paraflavitalea pollutisoli]|uniref:RagB/SusD family nutrient uptake outer membrane protein n=1 Tax=Paraflavitalea pollutisoli TaxID=3034143 RepID=UPI0023EBD433|nr:RagB/SusD family nutrient uptake outer membrane protein [Paraflavitalea sp. H1-2-19X]